MGGKVERTFFLPIKRAQAHVIINESMLFAQAVSDRVHLVKKYRIFPPIEIRTDTDTNFNLGGGGALYPPILNSPGQRLLVSNTL